MLYELRTYNAAPGKIDALNARFRDHTCGLFAKHGIGVAGFWINRADPNQLIYICTFQDAAQMRRALGRPSATTPTGRRQGPRASATAPSSAPSKA